MFNAELIVKMFAQAVQELIVATTIGHFQMDRQRCSRRAQRPNMQIVHRTNTRLLFEIFADRAWVDIRWDQIKSHGQGFSEQTPRAPHDDDIDRKTRDWIDPAPNPVRKIIMPAMTTPAETAASAAMCKNAPLMFKSFFRPVKNNVAVTPFNTMPTAATTIMVFPATSAGLAKRRIASQLMPPTATINRIALASAAKIDERPRPYVRRAVGRVFAK